MVDYVLTTKVTKQSNGSASFLALSSYTETRNVTMHDIIKIQPDTVSEWYFAAPTGSWTLVIKNNSECDITAQYLHGQQRSVFTTSMIAYRLYPGQMLFAHDYVYSSPVISFSSSDWAEAEIFLLGGRSL